MARINIFIIAIIVVCNLCSKLCFSQKTSREELLKIIITNKFDIDSIIVLNEVLNEFKNDKNSLIVKDGDSIKEINNSSGAEVGVCMSYDELIMWRAICFIEEVYYKKKQTEGDIFILIENKCNSTIKSKPNYLELIHMNCIVNGLVTPSNDSYDYLKKLEYSKKVIRKVYYKYYRCINKEIRKKKSINTFKNPLSNSKYMIIQMK